MSRVSQEPRNRSNNGLSRAVAWNSSRCTTRVPAVARAGDAAAEAHQAAVPGRHGSDVETLVAAANDLLLDRRGRQASQPRPESHDDPVAVDPGVEHLADLGVGQLVTLQVEDQIQDLRRWRRDGRARLAVDHRGPPGLRVAAAESTHAARYASSSTSPGL